MTAGAMLAVSWPPQPTHRTIKPLLSWSSLTRHALQYDGRSTHKTHTRIPVFKQSSQKKTASVVHLAALSAIEERHVDLEDE